MKEKIIYVLMVLLILLSGINFYEREEMKKYNEPDVNEIIFEADEVSTEPVYVEYYTDGIFTSKD